MSNSISSLGEFSSVSMSQMREERFKRLDANGDGVIDKSELQAGMKSKAGKNAPTVDEIFDRVDLNKDGVIDKDEDEAAAKEMENNMPAHRGQEANKGKSGFPPPPGDSEVSSTADKLSEASVTLLQQMIEMFKQKDEQSGSNSEKQNADASTLLNLLV
jgi:hypothetical protein